MGREERKLTRGQALEGLGRGRGTPDAGEPSKQPIRICVSLEVRLALQLRPSKVTMATHSQRKAEGSDPRSLGAARTDHALIGLEKRVELGVAANGKGAGLELGDWQVLP